MTYESRLCRRCGRDFLFPAYGKRICNDCRWGCTPPGCHGHRICPVHAAGEAP